MMPNSSESIKQANRVAIIGITSIRLHRQISAISCLSTMATMAHMMTAASVVFGMYWNEEVRKPSASNTMIPVKMPPIGVRTPLALFTAVRVNEPVDGIDWTNEPNILHRPSANISCVASTVFPLAENKHFFVKNRRWLSWRCAATYKMPSSQQRTPTLQSKVSLWWTNRDGSPYRTRWAFDCQLSFRMGANRSSVVRMQLYLEAEWKLVIENDRVLCDSTHPLLQMDGCHVCSIYRPAMCRIWRQ